MPVFLDRPKRRPRLFVSEGRERLPSPETLLTAVTRPSLEVGLVNNMPDLALEQTERQVLQLLDAAAGDLVILLKLFSMPDLPRDEIGIKHLKGMQYRGVDHLTDSKLDAIIITGAEPRNADLTREPYWHTLTNVFDWADKNTFSTILSCLAVHAGVLHFDGIDRHLLERKCFGVFEVQKVSNNSLLHRLPSRFWMPHSRWNKINESDLASSGYEILSRGDLECVDTFIKLRRSFFVFFQGHPEYEPWTLLGEYRRDVSRYLGGQQATYPDMPVGYFDEKATNILNEFKSRALTARDNSFLGAFPRDHLHGSIVDTWRSTAVSIYANWLMQVRAQKARLKKQG